MLVAMAVNPIPTGYTTVTPYLAVRRATEAIEWYKQVFAAEEIVRMAGPDGKLMHAEIRVGDAIIMLSDEFVEMDCHAPSAVNPATSSIWLYVPNVDQTFEKATGAGAKILNEVSDMFWGDRLGKVQDPFGHVWCIATHVEDLSQEEIEARAAVAVGNKPN
jgi:PhnB protein